MKIRTSLQKFGIVWTAFHVVDRRLDRAVRVRFHSTRISFVSETLSVMASKFGCLLSSYHMNSL